MSEPEQVPVQVGPFVRGVNNVDDPAATLFQVPKGDADKPPSLTHAVNVDLDRNGWLRRRKGRALLTSLVDGHSLVSINNRLLLVDAGVLYEVADNGTLSLLVVGVGNLPLSYCSVGDQIFYSSEISNGMVGGLWGLAMPAPPFLAATSGSLLPGTYLVSITVESSSGLESGARFSSVIHLTDPASNGISLTLSGIDPHAEYINIYCSEPNGRDLYWVERVPVTNSATITAIQQSTDPLRTFGLYPPPKGQFIAVYRGRILVATASILYWSQPLDFHHFRVQTDLQLFSSRITMLVVLDTGFFISTANETFWVSGDEPDQWTPTLVDSSLVVEGSSIKVPPQKLPPLSETKDIHGEIAMWATSDGFVAGLPDGTVKHLTDGRLSIDAYKHGKMLFREEDNLRQLLLTLQDKQQTNALGVTDKATCRVIRANENIGEP